MLEEAAQVEREVADKQMRCLEKGREAPPYEGSELKQEWWKERREEERIFATLYSAGRGEAQGN
jgi:hypothetical protein